MHRGLLACVTLLSVSLALAVPVSAQYEGFGAVTAGGDGYPVVRVTTLDDAGPGSLREALAAGGRTIVFDVAGAIVLADFLYVDGAFVTIDGFTAPPPGITLRNHGLVIRGSRGAHDVIVRGLRIRDAAIDGIQIAYGAYNVVVDHCSIAGSGDGNLDITEDSHDVTVSWSLLARPLAPENNMLVKYRAQRVTLHHNLFVSSHQRNPTIGIDDAVVAATDTTVDMRNNVVWGWGKGVGSVVRNGAWANVVANFYSSPDSPAEDQVNALIVCAVECGDFDSYPARAYVAENYSPDSGTADIDAAGNETAPFPAPPVTTTDVCTAAREVLAGAGVRPLDPVDEAFVSTVALPECFTDLSVSALAVPAMVTPGVPFSVGETSRNLGSGDAKPATVTFRVSTDTALDAGDAVMGRRVVPLLAAGATSVASTTITVPAGTPAGLYRIIASIDPGRFVTDTNAGNDVAVEYLRVVLPDLAVTDLGAPIVAAAGATIQITDATSNIGYGVAGSSSTRFYLSRDAVPGADDVALGARAVPALASRQASAGATTVTIPPGTPPGAYYIVASADADQAVAESRETNSRARTIRIQ